MYFQWLHGITSGELHIAYFIFYFSKYIPFKNNKVFYEKLTQTIQYISLIVSLFSYLFFMKFFDWKRVNLQFKIY